MSETRTSAWKILAIGVASPVVATLLLNLWSSSTLGSIGETLRGIRQTQERSTEAQSELRQTQAVIQAQLAEVRTVMSGIYLRREAEERHQEIYRTNQHQYGMLKEINDRLRRVETHL